MKWKKREEVLANGKLIVTDFKHLDPVAFSVFSVYTKEELENEIMVFSCDGKLYINSQDKEMADMLKELFNTLIPQTRYNLETLKKMYKNKYPNVKEIKDLDGMENVQKYEALTMLLIPVELKRRDVEKAYYMAKR